MTRNSSNNNDTPPQESPATGAAPPAEPPRGKPVDPTPCVAVVAIQDFNHDSISCRAAWTEKVGKRSIRHAPTRLTLSKAWAEHHVKAGNVVLEKDYTPGGDA